MRINPYLLFDGKCEAAFKFYERVLGGTIISMIPHAGTPAEANVPPEWGAAILHARLHVGDEILMGSDAPPGHQEKPQGFSVSIQIEDPAEAERVFNALAENATVRMPIAETFWALQFGMLVDQFGIPWMINCAKPT